MLRRLSHLLVLVLTLYAIAALAAGSARAKADFRAYDWEKVHAPGAPIEDGMLLPGRLILRFAPGATPERVFARTGGGVRTGIDAFDEAAERIGAQELERLFPETPLAKTPLVDATRDLYYVLTFDSERQSLRAAAVELSGVEGIDLIEPDPMHFLHAVLPNDPGLSSQWWLRSTVYGNGDVRALAAWYHETGSEDVVVCVADSGTDWQHPDLGGTGPDYTDGVIWINWAEMNGVPGVDDDGNGKIDDFRGWDFVTGVTGTQSPPQDTQTPDNDPMDYDGHGTSVAGCVAAITDNGIGVAGINWNASLMICRIGWLPPESDIGVVGMSFAAQSIDYARISGAHIYNASWGSSGISALVTATNNAIAAGMIIVTAAGNANNQVASYLAERNDVIAVAATGPGDGKTSFSSYGPWVDISAPGSSIFTTAYNRFGSNGTQHTYASPSGTSFAAPIVAGGFALAQAAYPGDTRPQRIARLLAAVDDITPKNFGLQGQLGSGRINLAKLFDNGPFWRVPEQLPGLIDAMNASDPGDTIAITSSMVLTERIVVPADKPLSILGAWNEDYTARDPENGLTRIAPPAGTGPTVRVLDGAGPSTILDGFEISGGRAGLVSFEPVDGLYGGGVLSRNNDAVLRNLRITGNVAGAANEFGAGGGIAVLGGSPLFENVVVTQNSARRGAGIYVHRGSPIFRNVHVHENSSYDVAFGERPLGGGVYVLDAPSALEREAGLVEVLFEGSTIENHAVNGPGGGIYTESSTLRLSSTLVRDNRSSGRGAGISSSGGQLFLESVVVARNVIDPGLFESGGGVFATATAIDVKRSRIQDNVSRLAGGGMALVGVLACSVSESFILRNTADFFGSGLYVEASPVGTSITSNTFADNEGASAGGNGAYFVGGSVSLERNLVAFNGTASASLADGVAVNNAQLLAVCNLVHANAAGNWSGLPDPTGTDGNLDLAPRFCAGERIYVVEEGSPAATAACGPIGAGGIGCETVSIGDPRDGGPVIAPPVLALAQNAPNPFNPTTTIEFSLPARGAITVRVHDLRGRLVQTLAEGEFDAGLHRIRWDGTDSAGRGVASGTYVYELRAADRVLGRKMGLLK
jgi:subtilisin family serine protease